MKIISKPLFRTEIYTFQQNFSADHFKIALSKERKIRRAIPFEKSAFFNKYKPLKASASVTPPILEQSISQSGPVCYYKDTVGNRVW